jgi:short-subunit dehydrogenase
MERPTALITGASSGIGFELARLAAINRHDVVLVARDADRLAYVATSLRNAHGVDCVVVPTDLAEPSAYARLTEELASRNIDVDILINNAGFGSRGRFTSLDLQRQLDMIQVNLTTVVALTRLLLTGMMERKRGRVLNVASTAAFQPGPNMAVYYATKAFLLHFSEGLSEELAGTGIGVTCLCPGPTRSEFAARANVDRLRAFRLTAMDAAEVAEVGWRGLMAGRAVVIPGFRNNLVALAAQLAPRWIVRKVAHALQAGD